MPGFCSLDLVCFFPHYAFSDANELSATVKAMNGSDIVECVPLAASGVRDKLVRVVAPREAAAILEQIDASEAATLLPSLPVEVHLNFIKAGRPSNVLHKMDDEAREALFAGLPDTLRRSAVEAYGDGNNIDTQRSVSVTLINQSRESNLDTLLGVYDQWFRLLRPWPGIESKQCTSTDRFRYQESRCVI